MEKHPAMLSPQEIRERIAWSDERLRAECVFETRRVRGPGGQHRNKTESAVRLHHRPSGVVVTGEERRSQHENAANAFHRLREALAIGFRCPLPDTVQWPASVHIRDKRLRVGERNEAYLLVVALALDALAACRGVPQEAAAILGVTTSSLVKFLHENPRAWREANAIRSSAALGPLRP